MTTGIVKVVPLFCLKGRGGFVEKNFLLEMKNIKKSFAGVNALKGVNFHVRKGEIHALMGENGAGNQH